MIRTSGTWSTADRHAYFLAGDARPSRTGEPHNMVLMAVNEICAKDALLVPKMRERIDGLLAHGVRVLLDSGVFWLTNEHKRAHGISMDEALALPPAQIDGFDWLWQSYLNVFRAYGDNLWGYIELDQGGAVNKRITRARLHDEGIFPMPVYHPLNDGWDYFDELAADHDRMCMGNMVQADRASRVRLLHTLSERHRLYPELWVHVLGFTPNVWVNALPVDSADSSTWLSSVRWTAGKDVAMHQSWSALPDGFRYRLGSDADDLDGHHRASTLQAVQVVFQQQGWRHWMSRLRDLGLDTYPAPNAEQPAV